MPFVNVAEAARRLGVSDDTIRRRIRSGELHARQEKTPQGFTWMVELDTDVPTETREATAGEVAALRELVEVLREQVERLSQQLERKDRQIQELHVLLQQAHRALPAPENTTAKDAPEATEAGERPAPWMARVWRRVKGG